MTCKKSRTDAREPPGSRGGSLYLSKDTKGAEQRVHFDQRTKKRTVRHWERKSTPM